MIAGDKTALCCSIWEISKRELCLEYPELIHVFTHPLIRGENRDRDFLSDDNIESLKDQLIQGENHWIEEYSRETNLVKDEILFEVICLVLRESEKFDLRLIDSIYEMIRNRMFSEKLHNRLDQAFGEKETGFHRRRGKHTGGDQEEFFNIKAKRSNYRDFLWRYMTTREELELDPDSFDYIYYTIGIEEYDQMPMLEELEYREINRLEELVIAIDTSGSCKKETVQRFLEETFSILQAKENFFKEMLVYLIQCDCGVQDVRVIRSEEDWRECQKKIVIQGRGGTDFGPVFRYVEQEQKNHRLKNLKALIYFTDGDGVYPDKETPYDTAFAFLEENEHMKNVPAWCHVLNVYRDKY